MLFVYTLKISIGKRFIAKKEEGVQSLYVLYVSSNLLYSYYSYKLFYLSFYLLFLLTINKTTHQFKYILLNNTIKQISYSSKF